MKPSPVFPWIFTSAISFFTASEGLSGNLFVKPLPSYTHAILNPPYKKIRSDSKHRAALRRAGIETANLYSAFLALSLSLLKPQGQLVAIVPCSFCNGPYYRRFRRSLLTQASIRQIHLFLSRNKAFKNDDVLQENIIIHLEKNGEKKPNAIQRNFENHLNVFHVSKTGLPETLAYGIMVFLNSTIVDDCFRTFNGHTQVNAMTNSPGCLPEPGQALSM